MRSEDDAILRSSECTKAVPSQGGKSRGAVQQNPSSPVTKHETPKRQHIRRRKNGSPIIPIDPTMPTKTIYLIRHGQSQGQVAKLNGIDRQKDPRLRDCGLTRKGEGEAAHIPKLLSSEVFESIQLVLSSPLTRALHTSLIAFPTKNIVVNFDLREVGCKAPENIPRTIEEVLEDLEVVLSGRDQKFLLDTSSLRPSDWPRDCAPQVIKIERIRRVFSWLYHNRDETVIVVVCHYNVIRSAVTNGEELRPVNGIPIRCTLYSNGDLAVND